MSKDKDREGFFEKIEEKIEEHKEEREAERENAKHDPNKKQREIDEINKDTAEFQGDVALAGAAIMNEET